MSLPDDFWEKLPERTDAQLLDALAHSGEYVPEAIAAVRDELHKRNLLPERVRQVEAETQLKSSSALVWYYVVEDGRHGPVSEKSLIATIESGALNKKTKIWKEGFPKWVILENTAFVEFLPRACPPPLDQVDTEALGDEEKPPPRSPPIPSVKEAEIRETKPYKIYENRAGTREAVKQGWSWPAFFFTWIWAFFKKMNATGAGILGAFFILTIFVAAAGAVGGSADEGTEVDNLLGMVGLLVGLVNLAIMVFIGVNGNAWREKNLLSRGYEFKGTVAAQTDEAALARYMDEAKANHIRQ